MSWVEEAVYFTAEEITSDPGIAGLWLRSVAIEHKRLNEVPGRQTRSLSNQSLLCLLKCVIRRLLLSAVRIVPFRFVKPTDEVNADWRTQANEVITIKLSFERSKKIWIPAPFRLDHGSNRIEQIVIRPPPNGID